MNQEDIRRIGVDIDEISLEANRLSRRLARMATQCGVKPPYAGGLSDRDLLTIREALEHRITTSGSDSHQTELNELLRRM
jgi:hypothetical protein